MIQINLVPDVKQELLRAQRQRSMVISVAILVSIAAVALVVVLAMYTYGVQAIRDNLSDNSIKSEAEKLASVEDLSNTLTIQNQLSLLSGMHAEKQITSRLFDILGEIDPPAPNNITIANVNLSIESSTVSIEGYAPGGFAALEVFKKTVEATNVDYRSADGAQSVSLAENFNIEETSYGENSDGIRVLRFSVNFTYRPEVLSYDAVSLSIKPPHRENATDSYRRLPQSLFGEQAQDIQEDN